MARLLSLESNKWVEVPDAQVPHLLATQQFQVPSETVVDGQLEMVGPEGDIVLVPMEEAQAAFGDGYRLEEAASKGARGLRKEYEGVLPGLASAAVGGLKGLSFGLSTPILRGAGVDVEALETFQPGAFTGGEIGGTLLGLVGTGGFGAAGTGVRAVAKGAQAAGAKVGAQAAAKSIFGKKLIEKATAGATEAAIDGAAFGGGQALHELTRGRAELSGDIIASTFFDRVTEGAMVGGAFGGGINLLGIPTAAAMRKLSGPAKKMMDAVSPVPLPKKFNNTEEFLQGIAEEAGYKSLGVMLPKARLLSKRDANDPGWLGKAKKWFVDTVDDEGNPLIAAGDTWEDIAPKLEGARDKLGNRLKGFYGEIDQHTQPGMGVSSSKIVKELEKLKAEFPDATTRAERIALDDAIVEAKKIGLKEDLRRYQELGGKPLQARMKSYTDWRGPEYRNFINAKHTMGKEGRGIRVVDDFLLDVEKLAPAQIDEIWDLTHREGFEFLKMRLPNTIETKTKWWNRSGFDQTRPKEVSQLNRKIGDIWRNEGDDAADEIIKIIEDIGGKTKTSMQEFRKLKDEFGYASEFWKIVDDRVLRSEVNRTFSLTDHLMTLGGSGIGLFGGGPIGGMVGGAIGAVANRYLRERGLSLTVAGAKSLSKLASVQNGAIDDIIKRAGQVASGTSKATSKVALPFTTKALSMISFGGSRPVGETKQEVMADLIGQLDGFILNPESLASRLGDEMGEIQIIAPQIAEEIVKSKTRMISFLQEKAPKKGESYSIIQPDLYKSAYLNTEVMGEFERYLYAAINPVNALFNDMADGTLSNETVETVETIYPSLFKEIKTKITEKIAGTDKVLSHTEMRQLAKIFGQPIMGYQRPEFMRRQQQQFRVESKGSMAGVKPSSASQGRTELLMQTDVNAVQSNLRSNKFA